MPILGIMASAISGNLWAPAGAYDSIATYTVPTASTTTTITFNNIPSTYAHLQVRVWGYNDSGSDRSLEYKFNNDASAIYANHYLLGSGATVTAGAATAANYCYSFDAASRQRGFNGDSTKASVFIIDVLDYTNTNKYKTVRALGGWDGNGTGYIGLASNLWQSTAAISRLDFTMPYASSYSANTIISLYGVK
jgi:hypothetical protein